jgi:hypothetical protein
MELFITFFDYSDTSSSQTDWTADDFSLGNESSSYRKQLTYCQTLQKHPLIVLPPARPNDLRKPWISLLFIGSHPSPNPSVTQNNQYSTRTNEHLNADASYFYPTTYLALAIPIVIFLP